MKHITIVVPEGENNLSSIVGSYKILTRANQHWVSQGHPAALDIHVAGYAQEVTLYGGLFSIHPEAIQRIRKTDLVIIPSINKDFQNSIQKNTRLIQWIKTQYERGAEVASICTGAFLLASTGLLKGKTCSTHWIAEKAFRNMFPDTEVVTEKIITDEHPLYTNGGAYSFLNLILYLVEKYIDRKTAVYCSKVFQIDLDRHQQSPFIIFEGQKTHTDDLILKAQTYIEKNATEKLSMENLASQFAVSRRNFDRRFTKATGNTPLEYLQRVKIEAAKRKLESGRKTVQEIMFDVGYSDSKAFRDVFRKITGLTPQEYKVMYGR
jgi:transcriptional regulator GlxA family with amidase domain